MNDDLPIWNMDGRGLRGNNSDREFQMMAPTSATPEGMAFDEPLIQPGNVPGATPATGAAGPTGNRGPTGPSGPRGSTGTHGTAGIATGTRGLRGPVGPQGTRGTQGSKGTVGFPGIQGTQGTIGPTGLPGFVRGPTGPLGLRGTIGVKDSIIRTPVGNVSFACVESGKPLLMVVLSGKSPLKIPKRFLASIVPKSAFVFSLSPYGCGAKVVNGNVFIHGAAKGTVSVAGTHKRFPNWNMPLVSESRRHKSDLFWRESHI